MLINITTQITKVDLSLNEKEAKLLKLMCAAKEGKMADAIRANGYEVSEETEQELTNFSADVFHTLKGIKIT